MSWNSVIDYKLSEALFCNVVNMSLCCLNANIKFFKMGFKEKTWFVGWHQKWVYVVLVLFTVV